MFRLWNCLVWDLCQTKTLCDPTLPGHRSRESVPLHTFHKIHLLDRLSPAVNTVHVAHDTTFFFSRTQQFPGECGDGQDSEDHGCPAEPLHGVSVLSMTHILFYMQRWALSSHSSIYLLYMYISVATFRDICVLCPACVFCKCFMFIEIQNLCCFSASSNQIRITIAIHLTATVHTITPARNGVCYLWVKVVSNMSMTHGSQQVALQGAATPTHSG